MTDEEHRLAALLQQAVPQPPRSITAEDITAQVARRATAAPHRFVPWFPALAAACVLLVIAAASVWLISGHSTHSTPTAKSPSASTSLLPTATSPSTRPRNSGDPVVPRQSDVTAEPPTRQLPDSVGPWSARGLYGGDLDFVLVSGPDAAYGLEGRLLDRFEPPYGNIAEQVQLDPNTRWPPLVTPRALWLMVMTDGAIILQMRDPHTLQKIGSLRVATALAFMEPNWVPVLAANSDASKLFLANANQLYSINPADGVVEHRMSVDGHIGGLAVSPDGSRLYVGVNAQGSGKTASLLILDIERGLSTISKTPLADGLVTNLLATSGAVWATVADTVYFMSLTDLGHRQVVTAGGGGLPASATLAGGVVWLTGLGSMACADASTGEVRAEARNSGWGNMANYVGSVQLVAGHWFGTFATNYSDDRGLAGFTPPAACR
ncbi:MAG TPA: hypothetical protein VGX49_16295 [Jatrophihabitans sp.]|jgi:hypothetical protein|nr:hypothetical protein [Jatrophihabitans sp.]